MNKQILAEQLLMRGSVFIHLDARQENVVCPGWLKPRPQLVLQVGYSMPIPIFDLLVDEEGISGTLSFSQCPVKCVLPWDAIYALVGEDGNGQIWADSMPAEVIAELKAEQARAAEVPSKVAGMRQTETRRSGIRQKRPLPEGWRVVK